MSGLTKQALTGKLLTSFYQNLNPSWKLLVCIHSEWQCLNAKFKQRLFDISFIGVFLFFHIFIRSNISCKNIAHVKSLSQTFACMAAIARKSEYVSMSWLGFTSFITFPNQSAYHFLIFYITSYQSIGIGKCAIFLPSLWIRFKLHTRAKIYSQRPHHKVVTPLSTNK